jgi:hypothetical protein
VAWAGRAVVVATLTAAALSAAQPAPPPSKETAKETAKTDEAAVDAALGALLPVGNATDVVVIDQPSQPRAPRVHIATVAFAPPDAVRALLLDPTRYRGIIPGLVKHDIEPTPPGAPMIVAWELEIPLFNLSGRLRLRPRPDGAELELYDGDLAPGRIVFTVAPRPAGTSTVTVDAQLDIHNSTFLIRHVMARSPVGEPAALAAAAYVALRATAMRAEHPDGRVMRPWGPMAPPPAWLPDARPLVTPAWAALRAHGLVALVARLPGNQRLGGVAVAMESGEPADALATYLRNPESWRALPTASEVTVKPGPNGLGAESDDSVPFADFDATWVAEKEPTARWTATDGTVRGSRFGWEVFPPSSNVGPGARPIAALLLYPRIELTGRIGRRSIASEPLLEHGMALALAFADVAGMKAAMERHAAGR